MLDKYFELDDLKGEAFVTARKRLIAVKAALEIAKHAVGSVGAATHSRVDQDLDYVAAHIEGLADAIQAALDKRV